MKRQRSNIECSSYAVAENKKGHFINIHAEVSINFGEHLDFFRCSDFKVEVLMFESMFHENLFSLFGFSSHPIFISNQKFNLN
jgi:hypothetical protein